MLSSFKCSAERFMIIVLFLRIWTFWCFASLYHHYLNTTHIWHAARLSIRIYQDHHLKHELNERQLNDFLMKRFLLNTRYFLDQCCPTVLTLRAVTKIILDAASRTAISKTMTRIYWTLLIAVWLQNRTFKNFK